MKEPYLSVVMVLSIALANPQIAPGGPQTSVGSGSESTDSGYQLQVQVPLVLEDLVIQDGNGNFVHGLKASDLIVTEDGKPAELRHFEEHDAATEPSAAALKLPDRGPNEFTNVLAKPDAQSWNILLLDTLNTAMTSQARVRQQMLNYVKTLPPGVPFAIFALDTRLHLLQGFTTDPNLLRAAIDERDKNPYMSPLLGQPVGDDQNLQGAAHRGVSAGQSLTLPGFGSQDTTGAQLLDAEAKGEYARLRANATAQALVELGRFLAGLPGRKNLIWLADSFPVGRLPEILERNRVALYTVDANGLVYAGPSAVLALAGLHMSMTQLAQETGGQAFFDTNGFKEAVAQVVGDGDNYYTFTYTPPDLKLDGTYRKIEVRCRRPHLRLYYRAGYFAAGPDAVVHGPHGAAPDATQIAMQLATWPGAPEATEILFDLQVIPEDKLAENLTAGAKPDPSLMKPPYRRYQLRYRVNLGDARFTTDSQGLRHGSLDFAALVYGSDGSLVNATGGRIGLDLPASLYAQLLERGLNTSQVVEAPARGDYFLRVVVYDAHGDSAGSVEVPLATLKSRR